MIIIESRPKGIKFGRHKEESLISSQFLKNQKEEQSLTFSDFYSIDIWKTFIYLDDYLRAP